MKCNLGNTLFGQARRQMLSLLYGQTDHAYYLREIIRITGIGTGPAQRELKNLTDSGIVTREVRGRQVYYQANERCPIFNELKSIVRKTFGVADILREALSPLAKKIKVAFIFGSVAKSHDERASDIDIMVIGEASFAEISSVISAADKQLQREVNPVVYPLDEFKLKVKDGHHFVKSVLEDEKIFLIGDDNELEKLVE